MELKLNNQFAQLPQETVESIWLGALLTVHFSDGETAAAAQLLLRNLEALRTQTIGNSTKTSAKGSQCNQAITASNEIAALRRALREEHKIKIHYRDSSGRATARVVWPLDIERYGPNGAMFCWCEKRADFRHFRFDRVQKTLVLPEKMDIPRSVLVAFAEIVSPGEF